MNTIERERARLVEVSSLPVFYIDGIGKVEVIESVVRTTWFEFRRIGLELVKMPVLEIVRPVGRDIGQEVRQMIERQLTADVASAVAH